MLLDRTELYCPRMSHVLCNSDGACREMRLPNGHHDVSQWRRTCAKCLILQMRRAPGSIPTLSICQYLFLPWSNSRKRLVYIKLVYRASNAVCRIWGSHSGGYEEFCLLGYVLSVESQLTFRRNISPPSWSGHLLHAGFFAKSSSLKMVYLFPIGLLPVLFFDPDNGGGIFLRNISWRL
jgi:hypothetical protein